MRGTSFLSFLLLSLNLDGTAALRSGKWCFAGCELNLNYVDFNDTGPGSKKIRSCQSELRATSLYLCVDEYCNERGRNEWLRGENETCQRIASVSLPPFDIIAEYSPDQRADIKRLTLDEAFTWPVLGEVVIPDDLFFERAFKTLDAAYFETDIHKVYGWALYYFWAIVLSIGIASRLSSLISSLRRREWQHIPTSPEEERVSMRNRTSTIAHSLLKRFVTVPATFNYRCSQPLGWCTIPPRIQSLTIFAIVLINIILCTISYRITNGNLWWPVESDQLWRYVSDRTGILSLANFPMIWLFGTRNNVLMWMTGWGFGAYNNFHRWVARVSTVQAVVHSVGYTVMIYERGGWPLFQKYLGKHYFWNGELATIFMCALLAFSVYGLRRSHYEIFLTIHIVFSIIVLLTMYYHVEIFTDGEWNTFIYPCLAVWIFDRTLRGLRILAFNYRFWNTKAFIMYDMSSNLVRMEVPCGKSWMKPKAGAYYYIYVLDDLLYAHQNHPFTLAYVKTDKKHEDADMVPLLPSSRRSSSTASSESDALLSVASSGGTPPSLVFLIRPYDGFTSRLARKAALKTTSVRVLIEGPYGHTVPLRDYPNIVFVVGGTGIAVPLSHIASLLSEGSMIVNLRIIWAVREHAFLSSVLQELRGLLEDERVSLEAHITQDEENKDDVSGVEMKRVRIEAGRPDVHAVIEDAAREAGHDRLAIVACGPAQMADQARQASVDMLARGFRGVEYFEESFKW